MTIIKLLSVLPLTGILTQIPVVDNQKNKAYLGARCRQKAHSEKSLTRISKGGIFNESSKPIKIVCPVKDNTLTNLSQWAHESDTIKYSRVNVVDNNSNAAQNVVCKIHIRNHRDTVSQEFPSTTGASTERQSLYVLHLGNGPYRNTEIECTLPPAQIVDGRPQLSGLVSYRVYEHAQGRNLG